MLRGPMPGALPLLSLDLLQLNKVRSRHWPPGLSIPRPLFLLFSDSNKPRKSLQWNAYQSGVFLFAGNETLTCKDGRKVVEIKASSCESRHVTPLHPNHKYHRVSFLRLSSRLKIRPLLLSFRYL